MKNYIRANDLEPMSPAASRNFEVEIPNKCPCCSTAYASLPSYSGFYQKHDSAIDVYAVFFCPVCEKAFFTAYKYFESYGEHSSYTAAQYPISLKTRSFSDVLSALSPKFVEIYHQAEIAENSGLEELCGIGYRKALEFLIKDYAVSNHPESQEEIEKSSLGQCIDRFIEDAKIKTLAKAATWLGNDETHYVKKHENYNVQDMKRFLSAAIAYVEYELTYDEAVGFLTNS